MKYLLAALSLLISTAVLSQNQPAQAPAATGIDAISKSLSAYNQAFPQEKLFLHVDKPYYSTGDTIWFKAYLLDNANLAQASSAMMYVELISDSLQIVKRLSFPIATAISWGQIALNDDEFPEGEYTLRAYTNWMQNFGEAFFFRKQIYIANTSVPHWLVAEQHKVISTPGKRSLQYAFQINDLSNNPVNFTELNYKITDGKKTLLKNKVQTLNGKIEGTLDLQEKQDGPFTIIAQSQSNPQQKAIIPVKFNDDIDLQFMPEGGYLVAGIPSRVGFKALSANGNGITVKGVIADSKNNEICEFESIHKGMGTFEITPAAGETYFAKLTTANNTVKTYALPGIKASGTVIRVNNTLNSDSVRVYVLLSSDLVDGRKYHLMGFANGAPHYGATFTATKQRAGSLISKKLFPTGIAHFTLFNDKNEPLNERLTFINHHDELKISLIDEQSHFSIKDSIPLIFTVEDASGNPVSANLSLSVTDDNKVKVDSLAENLYSSNLLSADLHGYIEDPGFYFSQDTKAAPSLDALLLTQGWKGYNWKEIFKPVAEAKYRLERDFTVSGRALNILNKPLTNAPILLLSSGKYRILKDTVTNSSGRFEFKNFPAVDTVSFFVQARNARGKSFNVGIVMDEIKPAKVSDEPVITNSPWYVNTDNTLLNFMVADSERRKLQQTGILKGGKLLTEVVIKGKKIVKNSKNQNGPGEADIIIDEAQIAKTPHDDLTRLLMSQVPGLSLRTIKEDQYYYFQGRKVRFVIDGVSLDRFFTPSDPPILNEYYDFVNNIFASVNAREVTGIEVMVNSRYTSSYNSQFLRSEELLTADFNYIEITTRSGKGLFMKATPGVAVYRPLPISWPTEFYRPKYLPGKPSLSPDLRSTIHWQPNLLSSSNGKTFTSFYAADKAATYTVMVQGTDMKGLLGYKLFKIKVEEK